MDLGLGLPERFALGAAIGTPALSISERAISFSGMRTATVENPPVALLGTVNFALKIIVKGPGQKISIKSFPSWFIPLTRLSKTAWLAICTIMGLSLGLPLASYIRATASLSKAFPPSP